MPPKAVLDLVSSLTPKAAHLRLCIWTETVEEQYDQKKKKKYNLKEESSAGKCFGIA